MKTLQMDRRTSSHKTSMDSGQQQEKDIVKQGIRLQKIMGTVGAIEYLKAHGIGGAVITRILAGGRLRDEDRDAWAPPASALCSAG